MTVVSHRQRMEACVAGEIIDRPPVALWRHFPVDDQNPESLAKATISYQNLFDFDFVKVTPASSFCLKDWGVMDVWLGSTEGTREYTKRVIHHPEDWGNLPILNPKQGYLAQQIECLQLIAQELGDNTPVIQTIFNPLSQAKNLVGGEKLLTDLRQNPQALHEGLRVITNTTLAFIDAIKQTGIAGIFYAIQHARYPLLSITEYEEFGLAYDCEILSAVEDLWLNVIHIHGNDVQFEQCAELPAQVLNWHDRETAPNLSKASELTNKVLCGGLRRTQSMVLGTPEQITEEALDAYNATQGKRFILGTGCVVPVHAPFGNIMAARKSVDLMR